MAGRTLSWKAVAARSRRIRLLIIHGRGTYLMHSGYRPQGPIQYPTFGSLLAREIGNDEAALPNFVSIAPFRQFSPTAYSSGFLGPQYAPLLVGETANPFAPGNQQT